jgi:3-hydroxy-9,10-secoandrosta-1,3,5(10)-triene-9,17-dione monooxygenase reductase component
MTDDTIDPMAFRMVLGRYPTGVTLVTAHDDDGPVAMVIGSFGSVSLDPPLVQFMPATGSTTWPRIGATGSYCVNVLGEDQLDVCNAFFTNGAAAFDEVEWRPGVTGSPIIEGCLAWIDCEIHAAHEAGDHLIVVGAVQAMEAGSSDRGPLLFLGGRYGSFLELADE